MVTQVAAIVRKAGERMLSISNPKVYEKEGHANFVSSADLAVQRFLLEQLEKLLPGSSFYAEEQEQNQLSNGYQWIIDPIDGTTNFLHHYQHSSISVALFQDQKPVCGVVYNPYMKEIFSAEVGKGAYLNTAPIQVPAEVPFCQALVALGTSPYCPDKVDRTMAIARQVLLQCADLRRSGSAALDLCYVACGRINLFFELLLSPWDYAAASIILQEAGGAISGMDGQPFGFERPIPIAAGAPNLLQQFLELANKISG